MTKFDRHKINSKRTHQQSTTNPIRFTPTILSFLRMFYFFLKKLLLIFEIRPYQKRYDALLIVCLDVESEYYSNLLCELRCLIL
jgi:hypothetical protein